MVRPLQSVSPLFFPTLPGLGHQQANDAHLTRLAPKYEELASLYSTNPSYAPKVTIAKVDATANDVPGEIQGFPTIRLFPAGAKDSPVEYNGDRTIEDLANFVKENGKHKIDAYAGKAKGSDDFEMPDAESMGKAAEAATKKGKDAAADATKKGKEATSKAGEKAADATDAAKGAADSAAKKGKEASSKAGEKAADATDAAKGAADTAAKKGKEAASSASSAGEKATSVAGESASKAGDKAAEATDKAGEKAEDAKSGAQKVMKAVKEGAEKVKEVMMDDGAEVEGHDEL